MLCIPAGAPTTTAATTAAATAPPAAPAVTSAAPVTTTGAPVPLRTTPAPQQSIAQAPTAPPAQALVCNGNTAPAESYVCGTSGVVYTASEYSALQASLGNCTALAGANSTKCGSFVLANDAYQAVVSNTCVAQCEAATAACPEVAPAPAPASSTSTAGKHQQLHVASFPQCAGWLLLACLSVTQ